MKAENDFKKWSSGFSGCDGGDLGSPDKRSTWVCGIEWGGGHSPEDLNSEILSDVTIPPAGYDKPSHNLDCIFNRQTMKLLAALRGDAVEDYEKTANNLRPFVEGSAGFFKMNLFPIAFKDTGHQRWQPDFAELTGFQNKEDYLAWCRRVRFAEMRSWVAKFKPKVIVCFGKTFITDFESAFVNGSAAFVKEPILNRELSWARTKDDVLIAVCPFPVNRYGLNSNELLHAFGDRIRVLTNAD